MLDKSISFSRTKQVDIKSQWPIVKLSSVVEIVSGGTPNTNNADYWDMVQVVHFLNGRQLI